MIYQKIRDELTAYYFDELPALVDQKREQVYAEMDAFDEAHPDSSSYFLKSKLYDVLAESVTPRFFDDLPFCFELGTLMPRCDGLYYRGGNHANGWLMERNKHLYEDNDPENYAEYRKYGFFAQCGIFADFMHMGIPMNKVFSVGLSGILDEIQSVKEKCETPEEEDFVNCAEAGIKALYKISLKISSAAKKQGRSDIGEMAERVPFNPPKTFKDGLFVLGFMRRALGTLEGYGFSSMGRPDLLLASLYENDRARGVGDDEMRDLVARFLLIWDCTNDRREIFEDGVAYELENSITLGGCDTDGNPLFNGVTRLFIEARDEQKCMYPKMMLRYSESSPEEYLKLISRSLANGQSYSLYENDDVTIPSLINMGYELKDARDYLVGGCWDVLTPDFGTKFSGEYFQLSILFTDLMKPDGGDSLKHLGVDYKILEKYDSFDELYNDYLELARKLVIRKHLIQNKGSAVWDKVSPACALSALMKTPLEKRRDVTAGGVKYSRECVYFTCFSEVADSLYVIKKLCFEEKLLSVAELIEECRNNWPDEELRQRALSLGSFGDGNEETTAFAGKFFDDLCAIGDDVPTAYGGKCRVGFNLYTEIVRMGASTVALPSGRKHGEYLSQGISPTRLNKKNSLSGMLNSYKQIDFKKTPGNASVTVTLPAGEISEEQMAMILKAFATCGLQAIQPSCVNRETLLAAKKCPEKYPDVIVRVCGFSAPFICLSEQYQDEIISRNISKV